MTTKTERWRDRAEVLRVIAETMTEDSAKRELLKLSRKWEEMAAKAENVPPAVRKSDRQSS